MPCTARPNERFHIVTHNVSAQLFQKRGHVGSSGLGEQVFGPSNIELTSAWARFTADYDPRNPGQVNLAKIFK